MFTECKRPIQIYGLNPNTKRYIFGCMFKLNQFMGKIITENLFSAMHELYGIANIIKSEKSILSK